MEKQTKNNTIEEIWTVLSTAKKPVCFIDSRPDFDAFGASLALQEVLRNLNINLELYYYKDIPEKITSRIDISTVEQNVNPLEFDFSEYDLLIMMDTGSEGHLVENNTFVIPEGIAVLTIDHHASNTRYGTYNYVDGEASSAALVLFRILEKSNIEINQKMADLLMLGIITDNGFFQFQNTTGEDLRAVAALMERGADLFSRIWGFTFEQTLNDMRVKELAYNNLVVKYELGYAYTTASAQEIKEKDLDLESTEKPANVIKRLTGVNFVFAIRQDLDESTTYHVSFRSHLPTFNVLQYAEKLNGGGHIMAAGGTLSNIKNMEDAVEKVLEII